MKIWNDVGIQETLYNAEVEAKLWHWILEQKIFKLQNFEINILEIMNFIFLDLKYNFNKELFAKDKNNLIRKSSKDCTLQCLLLSMFQQFSLKINIVEL